MVSAVQAARRAGGTGFLLGSVRSSSSCSLPYLKTRIYATSSEVQAYAAILSSDSMRLHSLPNLHSLVISFSQTGVATQQAHLKKIIKLPQPYLSNPVSPIGSPLHAPKAFSRLESLTLTALCFIDKALLTLVAKNFPNLTSLCLSCTDRLDMDCCWGCFQESASCAIGISPIPDMFASVDHLAVCRQRRAFLPSIFLNETICQNVFAGALKPLHSLAHLHLGIFLCNESVFNAHFSHIIDRDHSGHDCEHRTLPFGPETCIMCRTAEALCMVRECELAATKIMAKKLKSLKSLGWSTIFANNQSLQLEPVIKVGDPGRRTTRWVLRKDGKLFLRMRPW